MDEDNKYQGLVLMLVPEEIAKDFEFEEVREEFNVIRVVLKEREDNLKKIDELKSLDASEVSLNGFLHPIELQTFPTKGKEVFLYLHRRRWKRKGAKDGEAKSYHNTYDYDPEGMKATYAFADFLKSIDW